MKKMIERIKKGKTVAIKGEKKRNRISAFIIEPESILNLILVFLVEIILETLTEPFNHLKRHYRNPKRKIPLCKGGYLFSTRVFIFGSLNQKVCSISTGLNLKANKIGFFNTPNSSGRIRGTVC